MTVADTYPAQYQRLANLARQAHTAAIEAAVTAAGLAYDKRAEASFLEVLGEPTARVLVALGSLQRASYPLTQRWWEK